MIPYISLIRERRLLPFEDESFEIVCADLCLHYFKEKDTRMILEEISRVLTMGGHLFVRVNSVNDVNHGAGQGVEIELHLYKTEEGMFKRFFSNFDILYCEEEKMFRYSLEKIVYSICLKKK